MDLRALAVRCSCPREVMIEEARGSSLWRAIETFDCHSQLYAVSQGANAAPDRHQPVDAERVPRQDDCGA